jgi:arsenite methyltransferase
METQVRRNFTSEEKKKIRTGIREKYTKVALGPHGSFNYPTGREGLEKLDYNQAIISSLPEDVLASYCGVGNPFVLGPVHEGQKVLDIGCGAGVDVIIAAKMVGSDGRAEGIDLTLEMVAKARENFKKTYLENGGFQVASAEQLPFADGCFDVVLSNGAMNLVPEKLVALREAFRVLKPGGRLMAADQILIGELPDNIGARIQKWSR